MTTRTLAGPLPLDAAVGAQNLASARRADFHRNVCADAAVSLLLQGEYRAATFAAWEAVAADRRGRELSPPV